MQVEGYITTVKADSYHLFVVCMHRKSFVQSRLDIPEEHRLVRCGQVWGIAHDFCCHVYNGNHQYVKAVGYLHELSVLYKFGLG